MPYIHVCRHASETLRRTFCIFLQGIVTAPLLFALEQEPQILDLISRKFKNAGDVELVRF
jgi:hypothetical protein